jgi:hypothetical protein
MTDQLIRDTHQTEVIYFVEYYDGEWLMWDRVFKTQGEAEAEFDKAILFQKLGRVEERKLRIKGKSTETTIREWIVK